MINPMIAQEFLEIQNLENVLRKRRESLFAQARKGGATLLELKALSAIDTIRAYKEETNCTLLEAKAYIDSL